MPVTIYPILAWWLLKHKCRVSVRWRQGNSTYPPLPWRHLAARIVALHVQNSVCRRLHIGVTYVLASSYSITNQAITLYRLYLIRKPNKRKTLPMFSFLFLKVSKASLYMLWNKIFISWIITKYSQSLSKFACRHINNRFLQCFKLFKLLGG